MADISLLDVYEAIPTTAVVNMTADRVVLEQGGALKKTSPQVLNGKNPGTDIASDALVDLTGLETNAARITGTTNITQILLEENKKFEATFTDSLTLVYDPTDLPIVGGKDVVTQANWKVTIVGGAGDIGAIEVVIPYVAPADVVVKQPSDGVVKFDWFTAWFQAAASAFWVVLNFNDVVTTTRQLIILMHDANRTLDMQSDFRTLQSCEALLASETVDTDVGTDQALYTVPTDKKFVPTKVVIKEATADMSTIGDSLLFGFNGANDFASITSGTLSQLTDDSKVCGMSHFGDAGASGWVRGNATDVFGCKFNDTSITGGQVTIDVFGYLYDA